MVNKNRDLRSSQRKRVEQTTVCSGGPITVGKLCNNFAINTVISIRKTVIAGKKYISFDLLLLFL